MFVNSIVKLSFVLFLSAMIVSETLDFSIFPSHDTLVVDEVVTMGKLVIAIRRISLIVDFMIFIYGYSK
ncbi:flagellar biosynthesis protein FlhA [Betaproteobacteria bacterium]|nr:flagellar biosynthesis protein FlhA [Betaproteobacteria bacterium]